MTTKLSLNFSLEELTTTSTGLSNVPTGTALQQLTQVAQLLQQVRDKFGILQVTSGFRSAAVHKALTQKGAPTSATSQHLLGEAVDFIPKQASHEIVFRWIKDHLIFGQVIDETHGTARWIHLSLPRTGKPNQQALRFQDGKYTTA